MGLTIAVNSLVTRTTCATYRVESYADITTMLDYAQIHIFDAVISYGRYQGCLLLIFILHNVMHDITSTLHVGDMPYTKMAAPC